MKISELYGKEVESLDKKKSGYVLGVSCDKDKIEFLLCCDEKEREFFIDVNSIASVGQKIIYEDADARKQRAKLLRLGKAGYSQKGKFMGHLCDCEVSGFMIKSAYIGKKKYSYDRLICGDVIIISEESAQKSENEKTEEMSSPLSERKQDAPDTPHSMFISAMCN